MTGEQPALRLKNLRRRDEAVIAAHVAQAARHARRVALLKIVLPLLAVLGIGAVFLSVALTDRPDEHFAGSGAPGIEMDAPVLTGTSQNGKPYKVTASGASQTREGLVELKKLDARLELEDGPMHLVAAEGSVHPETGAARVSGGVVIELADQYRLETERAEGNVKTGVFSGDAPVRVTGPQGVIEAAGFHIDKSIKRLTFTGGVNTTFDPAAVSDSKDKAP